MAQARLIATIVVELFELYLLVGAVTALAFVSVGIARVLPPQTQVTLGARVLVLAGAAGLWPVVLRRWIAARGAQ